MISYQELKNSLYGAYRLAWADRSGMAYFNVSLNGFWKSFFAAILVAPLFLALIIIRFRAESSGISAFRFIAVEFIAYIIGWTLFPLIMYSLASNLNRVNEYFAFIIAYNWASVIQNGVYVPFAILTQVGLFTGPNAGMINLIILVLVVLYTWFIACTALRISGVMAGGIVLLDVGLWIILSFFAETMLVPAF
ncbi:MAG: hypothetical protein VX617_03445 [Pseudomonadota bacterium]|nr:hypothetical protein [Pseudomonadota bacterium]